MYLTYEQVKWLNSRGGRDFNDLVEDEDGRLFVYMTNGKGGEKKVYLPNQKFLNYFK